MNMHLFRLVFNQGSRMMVPVWEGAKARTCASGRARGRRGRISPLLGAGAFWLMLAPLHAELPVPCGGGSCGTSTLPNLPFVGGGAAAYSSDGINAIVRQDTASAILNWQSFNIGAGNSVEFRQPDSGSTALNRIWQADPSQINGSLKANGQIYLINQNGIIFGSGAQVSTSSLVASALNISDELFNKGGLFAKLDGKDPVFTWQGDAAQYQASFIRIDNGARLKTDSGGLVMVLAPKVENLGEIATPDGETVLAAGAKVYIALPPPSLPEDHTLRGMAGLLVEVDPFEGKGADGQPVTLGGTVTNGNGQRDALGDRIGRIIAERGNVTLAGLAVNQNGRITATTSVRRNGSIRLLARDGAIINALDASNTLMAKRGGSLVLGADSLTEVLPELTDNSAVPRSQELYPSRVELAGRSIQLKENAAIVAPGGRVRLVAQADQQRPSLAADAASRIYLAPGSRIDVSGSDNVPVAMERNFMQVELRGDELKDSPLQRNSFLRGKKVWIDIREGTPLANVDGYIDQAGRTIGEQTAAGGEVSLTSDGDVVMREGSSIDVSGGGLQYQDGYGKTTRLVSEGRIYDISDAPADRIYDGFATFTRESWKWGVTQSWGAFGGTGEAGYFIPGYYEGKSAGEVAFNARGLVLDGTLLGATRAGPQQREANTLPQGGGLVMGGVPDNDASAPFDFRLPGVTFSLDRNPLPGGLDADYDTLPESWKNNITLSTEFLREGGFNRLAVYSNGNITIPKTVDLSLKPGGSLTLTGQSVDVQANIDAPAGKIVLATKDTAAPSQAPRDHRITVGDGVRIMARGQWVNDSPLVTAAPGGDPALIDGGSITMTSVSDVILGQGSVLDVSGGGWAGSDNRLKAGNAGGIHLATGSIGSDRPTAALVLGGELRGYALGKGGTLGLSTSSVRIGGQPSARPGELALTAGFFQQGGFSDYVIAGGEGLSVAGGADGQALEIALQPQSLVLDPGFLTRRSGADIGDFSRRTVLPVEQRAPATISLRADSRGFGDLTIERNATIKPGPGGEVFLYAGKQLNMMGAIEAPAGKITLGNIDPQDFEFNPGQSIWIGSEARLSSTGYAQVRTNDRGLREGDALRGGEISITASSGYVVTEAGSVIDVSGVSTELDLPGRDGAEAAYSRVPVAGDAGSIRIAAREGALLDGQLKGTPGGGQARGGNLVVEATAPGKAGYPRGPRSIEVRQQGPFLPQGLKPGAVIDPHALDAERATLNGKTFLAAQAVRDGGFDQLSLKSHDRIAFDGDVDLSLRRAIHLDAPVLAAAGAADVKLDAMYVALGNNAMDRQNAGRNALPGGGEAELNVSAGLIDVAGNSALQGIGKTTLDSRSDIRFKGVLDNDKARELSGALISGGDMTLRATRIYPATMSRFTLAVQDGAAQPGGKITIEPGRGDDTPLLSAAGNLTLRARSIEQRGVIKAPFGEITLDAAENLTLAPGSVTSVSAGNQITPFGRTELTGGEYVYALSRDGNNLIQKTAPEKVIRLRGAAVDIAADAVVDLSGGGDLRAYEFTPGPGGSRDVLDPAGVPASLKGSFAIVPWLNSPFAPYDHQEYPQIEGMRPGDGVYLSGANSLGLKEGVYAVLPARYALLDGALLVTPASGYRDMPAGLNVRQPDGGVMVSGYRAEAGADGTLLRDARASGFVVRSGAVVRQYAEYRETSADAFFGAKQAEGLNEAAQTVGDAGRLAIAATRSLALNGALLTGHAAGQRGAEVDISAPRLAVVSGDDGGLQDFVRLDAASLGRLNVSSLLLGGTRQTLGNKTGIQVGARQVVVNNDSQNPLSAPEIILAASDEVKVGSGSLIQGKGAYSGKPKDLILGNTLKKDNEGKLTSGNWDANGDGRISELDDVSGNGALLRLSSGDQVAIRRDNVDRSRGDLVTDVGALLRADKSMALDATRDNDSQAALELGAGGSLAVGASRINLGQPDGIREGLKLSAGQLAGLSGLGGLALRSYSTVDIHGAASIGNEALKNLSIEAAGLGGYDSASGQTVTLHAQTVSFANPNNGVFSAPAIADGNAPSPGQGSLRVDAQQVILGDGKRRTGDSAGKAPGFEVKGFAGGMKIEADEILGQGRGELKVADGDLTLEAARITATSGADQTIRADGALITTLAQSSAPLDPATALGARMAFFGKRISHGGRIDAPSGTVTLTATGSDPGDDVILTQGSQINAGGAARTFADTVAYAPGGRVELRAGHGNVGIDAGALVDVGAAPGGGDAGRLDIAAAEGEARIEGTLRGDAAAGQRSGEFNLDAQRLAGSGGRNKFSAVNDRLNGGGFAQKRHLRLRGEDITVADTDVVKAREIRMVADGGAIDVSGRLDASGAKGGSIALLAKNDVTLRAGALLDASATTPATGTAGSLGDGGKVMLGTTQGSIDVRPGSVIDVSGRGDGGEGGSVLLRAPRLDMDGDGKDDEVAVTGIGGEIRGQQEVVVEAFKRYDAAKLDSSGATTPGGNLNTGDSGANARVFAETRQFIDTAKGGIIARLPGVRLRPGIEIRGANDLALAKDWNLGLWRFGAEPGVLTLRAAGNLKLDGSLDDGFTKAGLLLSSGDSWSYRLTAGADSASADPLAVLDAGKLARDGDGNVIEGDLTLAGGKLIRTGAGSIDIATGNDLILKDSGSVIYTAGVAGPVLQGFGVPTVDRKVAQYPLRGGDIGIAVQRNINGVRGAQLINDWLYRQGGLNPDGTVQGGKNASEKQTSWWTRFSEFQQGVGALGGGDITISAGGDINNLSAVIPTHGRLKGVDGERPDPASLVVQGGGDLELSAGGGINSGVFYVAKGQGRLGAGGGIGKNDGSPLNPVLALGDARIDVRSAGDLAIETVLDPAIIPQVATNSGGAKRQSYFFGYSENSAVSLLSRAGDITLSNDATQINEVFKRGSAGALGLFTLYPGTLRATAFGGDIGVQRPFSLFPAAKGNIELLAKDSIDMQGTIRMSDVSPASLPSPVAPDGDYQDVLKRVSGATDSGFDVHSSPPLHGGDLEPARLVALGGDITGPVNKESGSAEPLGYFPKPLLFSAGRDIRNVWVVSQNLRGADVTRLQAGRDVVFETRRSAGGALQRDNSEIALGGPGRLVVIAGRDVDLGASKGIVTVGNAINPYLPPLGADVVVMAGMKQPPSYDAFIGKYLEPGANSPHDYSPELAAYLRKTGQGGDVSGAQAVQAFKALPRDLQAPFINQVFYNELKASGREAANPNGDRFRNYDRGRAAIATLFPGGGYDGDINLYFSQIKTEQGGDIELMAPGGSVNAGLASLGGLNLNKEASGLGIVTLRGGSVKGFVDDDFLVNQSRVFTLQGGDILLWASHGDIDAGKGSKTARATPPPRLVFKDNKLTLDISQSVSGSGIGVLLAKQGITPGDVDLIAPEGEVNAGDAGIRSAGNLNIAALRVIGADNIQVAGVSTGVPVVDTGAFASGLSSASGAATSAGKGAEDATRALASQAADPTKTAFRPSFLTVEVIGFGD
ncbi:MAG: filamentous hemagglutinin family protein [Pseudomonadota bacterium]